MRHHHHLNVALSLVLAIVIVEAPAGKTAASEPNASEVTAAASSRFANRNTQDVPDFQKHVAPLLGQLGCNAAKCHGSFQGQGGFRLSLFGFDFQADHEALRSNSRVNLQMPDQSLLLRKPTIQTDHEGGRRFELNSWEHHLLRRWIQTGANGASMATKTISGKSTEQGSEFFIQRIQPLLENHCYECHGFNNRKGGLSIATREALLTGGAHGSAIVLDKPQNSRLLKAVRYENKKLQMPPNGRLNAQQISDLEKWVRMGAPWSNPSKVAAGDTNLVLRKLRIHPEEIIFESKGRMSQIRVIAEWSNGEREDVTCLCRFQSNDDAVVSVNRAGLAASVGEGDTLIVVFYDNGVAAIPVFRPYAGDAFDKATRSAENAGSAENAVAVSTNPIDQFVNKKLLKLRLLPSQLCSDSEFLRRVSIDMTGTLPTPIEVTEFLADESKDKRERKIDELLERPTYAAWWTNKLCDFTGCNPKSISSLLEVAREDGYVKASEWYDWIFERVTANQAYDKLVEGIMLAELSGGPQSMPHFWTRQSLKEPKDTALSVAHAFLGIQLQCAECHKHPFDRWTQADFHDFSQFFESVTATKRRSSVATNQELRILRSRLVKLQPGDDPRVPVMQWMSDKNNPWFARAFVNRVWAGYFNVGIVEPPDQFTPANPPSNAALLDWLSKGFVESGYDMKWLHRQITASRTYQRSWRPNATNRLDRRNFSRAIPRRIPAEVVYDSMKQATASNATMDSVRTDLRRRATGHLSMRMAGTHAMKVFGKPDRSINCDCERVNEPTLLQSIFMQNDPLIRMRIADSGWILQIEDAENAGTAVDTDKIIKQVWLRTVNRPPTDSEFARAKRHLGAAPSLAEGVSDLMWAMLNSKEFLLNK